MKRYRAGVGTCVSAAPEGSRWIACLALLCGLIFDSSPRPLLAFELPTWLNPESAPFLPIPDIETAPDTGNTFGIMPAWLQTDQQGEIKRIIAPDFYHNSYFGWGLGGSLFMYPSADSQWWIGGDVEQRVERQLDSRYQSGRERLGTWSFSARLDYDRIGTPRFFGIGNETPLSHETNYTSEAQLLEAMPGWNITPQWQLAYTFRAQNVDVFPGSLPHVTSIERRFGPKASLGRNDELTSRLSLIYDTRNDLTAPTRGVELVAYTSLASRRGILNSSLYSASGLDARAFVPLDTKTVLALHTALRYMTESHQLPFWAYSTIGGEESEIGREQTLRGFGMGRFTDRDSFVINAELRRTVASINATSHPIDLELTPFLDAGRVFGRNSTNPLSQLHYVPGLGLRGVARPFVVGYVDLGYGGEGLAVFTGINYPF